LDEDIDLDYHVNRHINEIFKKVERRRNILKVNRNKQRRTQFVQKMSSWRDVKRKRIVWADSKVFSLHLQSGKGILKVPPEEDPLDFALPRVQQGGGAYYGLGSY